MNPFFDLSQDALGFVFGLNIIGTILPSQAIGKQNKALLLNADDSLTARGQQIIDHTPMGRFGNADELLGTVMWLLSPASQFVTGIIVPVDGGFSAFSGV
ncbi:MAG: SDR family oxidoreductase [Chloroflexi bacterium]|nr:SDR family oxidoreductase [Chloroflexota bacterium]